MTTTTETTPIPSCSCGEAHPHKIARRVTADGIAVEVWSDGAVVGRWGFKLPGVPIVRPRTPAALSIALTAAWLLAGEVEAHDLDEVGDLYGACRRAAKHGGRPGDVRAHLADARRPKITPVWTVVSTDRDGHPTERFWRLPRLRWPGMVVWDHVSVGASGGRYEIMHLARGTQETCVPTGIRFATLAGLAEHLLTEKS